jgi:rRNA pseudouridine-1189 N-methylase Emg1 (Nep1/Mra1 family)
MKITKIKVNSSATIPHPYERFSNLHAAITLEADVQEGEDPELCAKDLRNLADTMVRQHKAELVEFEEVKLKLAEPKLIADRYDHPPGGVRVSKPYDDDSDAPF